MKKDSVVIPVFAVVVFVLAFGFVGTLDLQDSALEEIRYCEMVELYKSGHGGWPDYKEIYPDACK